jgi:hypothetical protein
MSKTAKLAHVWERDELDWYQEPTVATDALLTVESFVGAIHDPCCGGGNIVKTLISAGYEARGSDVVDRAGSPEWFTGCADFTRAIGLSCPNIVMNPPFFRAKGAEAFIRKALSLASGKIAAFVDIRFITGAQRANGLFSEYPPARIWVVTPRVSCPPGAYLDAGNIAGGGTADWVWLVWDRTTPQQATQFGWLRRVKA